MRIGDAYLSMDLGYGQDDLTDLGLTQWMVNVVTHIDGEQVALDTYLGGPSIPWRYEGEHSVSKSLFGDEIPMTDFEKDSYQFSEMSEDEKAHSHDQPNDESNDLGQGSQEDESNDLRQESPKTQVGNANIGVVLGVGGIIVAFMMMR